MNAQVLGAGEERKYSNFFKAIQWFSSSLVDTDMEILKGMFLQLYVVKVQKKKKHTSRQELTIIALIFLHIPFPYKQTNKQTLWPLVRKRTIPTERPPLVDEI
jgi:hypothetical protein